MDIVKGNPLYDITNTRNVQQVIKSGQLYYPHKLLEQFQGNTGPDNESEVNSWFKYPDLMKEAARIKKKDK
jgi:hypothetical protein